MEYLRAKSIFTEYVWKGLSPEVQQTMPSRWRVHFIEKLSAMAARGGDVRIVDLVALKMLIDDADFSKPGPQEPRYKDEYHINLIEGYEPTGLQAFIRAESWHDAVDELRDKNPHVRGFPADVTNMRTGATVKVDL